MLTAIAFASVAFLEPALTVNGRDVRTRGSGPPIVFSPGLFGTMLPAMYGRFLETLSKKGVTVVTLDGFGTLKRDDVEEIADVIGVERIGVLTHSSFDVDILQSERVEKALLLDPSALPGSISLNDGIQARRVDSPVAPTRIIKTELAYDSESPFIPDAFEVKIADTHEEHLADVGHTDLLDDFFADIGNRVGIRGMANRVVPTEAFRLWSFKKDNPKVERDAYRKTLADRASAYFLG